MPVSGIFLYNSETSTISKATADTSTALIANVERYDQCKVAKEDKLRKPVHQN